ncbi:hypothetical protein ACTXT7_008926 [Hymenolepis weldensis]
MVKPDFPPRLPPPPVVNLMFHIYNLSLDESLKSRRKTGIKSSLVLHAEKWVKDKKGKEMISQNVKKGQTDKQPGVMNELVAYTNTLTFALLSKRKKYLIIWTDLVQGDFLLDIRAIEIVSIGIHTVPLLSGPHKSSIFCSRRLEYSDAVHCSPLVAGLIYVETRCMPKFLLEIVIHYAVKEHA